MNFFTQSPYIYLHGKLCNYAMKICYTFCANIQYTGLESTEIKNYFNKLKTRDRHVWQTVVKNQIQKLTPVAPPTDAVVSSTTTSTEQ